MATFVLVHGAWHGSWCWKRVRRALQTQGHEVFTPTLTGLGERSHLLSQQIDLETHILDVVNLIIWEELTDVVLCGHSYGGAVISGVADRLPDRIRALVYLDAFVLEDGENVAQHVPGLNSGPDWQMPPLPAESFNVNSSDVEWVNRQCTMHPLATFQQRIRLTGESKRIRNVTYILANGYGDDGLVSKFFKKATENGWNTIKMPYGHDVMLDGPEELTAVLLDVDRSAATL
ncbi:MAG: alpha/beta fold hydrolase [Candidatus Latescibacteria bacterium]|nr:alpha/beta fold hydrolase [Candidatus Latescibacterota bacterium]